MEANLENLLQRLTEFIQKEAKTETVIGDSFQLGDFTCVPVVSVGVGFGSGGGTGDAPKAGKGEGSGAVAGLGVSPIGFLVARGDQISFIGTQQSKGISAIFEKVPGLMEKMMARKKEPATV